MKRIAVLTSGGDAPGMNAAIRAVVRSAKDRDWDVFGYRNGYAGLIQGDAVEMGVRDVGGIIQKGGTILGSARCEEFKTDAGCRKAVKSLEALGIQGLIVIGGNGSQKGANRLSQMGFPVVGIASTIDNDLYGAEISIGVDTALNIALEAIDRLKVTASSHHRAFLVEVMGRRFGYLALVAAIAGGAEEVILPDSDVEPEALAAELRDAYKRGKPHALVVVAEGARLGATALYHHFEQHRDRLGFTLRVTILGHVQRGGAPGAFDRILGTQTGAKAVDCLSEEHHGVLLGLNGGKIETTSLHDAATREKILDPGLLRLAKVLSR